MGNRYEMWDPPFDTQRAALQVLLGPCPRSLKVAQSESYLIL